MFKNFFRHFVTFVKRNAAPFVAGGALFVFVYIVFFGEAPSPNSDAPNQVGRFRKWYAFRNGRGTWYDIKDYKMYIDTFEKRIKYAESKNPDLAREHTDPTKYKWVIGFYWKRTKDPKDNEVKYSYCMIPTLVRLDGSNGGKGSVVDYFEDGNQKDPLKWHYNHDHDDKKISRGTRGDEEINPYDNGQLWP